MALSGVESVRVLFPWAALQPRQHERIDFDRTDRTVEAAAAHRIEVLPTVLYTPYWARRYKRRPMSPPMRTSEYTTFLRALIKRYGFEGSFWVKHPELPFMPIRQWQIWNEPNITSYWDASPKSRYGWPRGYGALLRAANKTIDEADPGARTVFAGLTGIAWLDMRRAYRHGGIRNHFDVAALQVYPQTVAREVESVRRLRSELVRARDRDVRMYVTEVAFPASKGRVKPIHHQRQQTPRGMARSLSGMYGVLSRQRRKWGLERVYWYTWATRYGRSRSNFDFGGLVRSRDGIDYQAQPALEAFQRNARRYQGCVKGTTAFCSR